MSPVENGIPGCCLWWGLKSITCVYRDFKRETKKLGPSDGTKSSLPARALLVQKTGQVQTSGWMALNTGMSISVIWLCNKRELGLEDTRNQNSCHVTLKLYRIITHSEKSHFPPWNKNQDKVKNWVDFENTSPIPSFFINLDPHPSFLNVRWTPNLGIDNSSLQGTFFSLDIFILFELLFQV